MNVLRFIKWQWNRFSTEDQIVLLSLAAIVIFIICAITFSLGFIFSIVTIVAFIVSILIIVQLVKVIRIQWNKYNKQMEQEQQAIVDKLAGRRTN